MPKKLLQAGYRTIQPHPNMPSIQPGAEIPIELRTRRAATGRIGFGPIYAIIELLSGRVSVKRTLDARPHLAVTFVSSARKTSVKEAEIHAPTHNSSFGWVNAKGRTTPFILGLIHYIIHGDAKYDVKAQFRDLTEYLNNTHGINLPTADPKDWETINADPLARGTIIALSDKLYYAIRDDLISGRIMEVDTPPLLTNTRVIAHADLHLTEAGVAPKKRSRVHERAKKPVELTPLARLKRLSKSGGTALLTGPTGAFKTETGKRLAIETGAQLINLKGAPGIEDRDFMGSITPTEHGPKWVDGPLTRAFKQARDNKVVLLIDELLRFEPLYANVLVGALDTVTPEELTAMGHEPVTDGTHYAFTLPTGETITAPTKNLTIVATTNQGDDYEQFGNIDAALLGRFALQIDMPTADPNVLTGIYQGIINDTPFITRLLDFEEWTRNNTGTHGGLLKRATNPRVTINFLNETKRLMDEQLNLTEAALAAFEVTIIPYCTPRDTQGMLAEDAMAVLKDEFTRNVTNT